MLVSSHEKLAAFESEARAELFRHLFREGRLDEARRLCTDVLAGLPEAELPARLEWGDRLGLVERKVGNLRRALGYYQLVSALAGRVPEGRATGTHFNGIGAVYLEIAEEEGVEEFKDKALLSFDEAAYHFERAGEVRLLAVAVNNVVCALSALGRTDEAHGRLDRARRVFIEHGEPARVAEIDDTRAQVYLRQGRLEEAFDASSAAVSALMRTDERLTLGAALRTHLRVLEAVKTAGLDIDTVRESPR